MVVAHKGAERTELTEAQQRLIPCSVTQKQSIREGFQPLCFDYLLLDQLKFRDGLDRDDRSPSRPYCWENLQNWVGHSKG
jgi:hypothetical protein